MQAIACVNRVFKDKPGGLVVVYLGPPKTWRGLIGLRIARVCVPS